MVKYFKYSLFAVLFFSAISIAQNDIIIDSDDYGDRLKIGFVWSGDLSFNPIQINSDYDKEFANLVFGNGLFTKNDSDKYVKHLVLESEFQSPTLLRIKLKPNLTFHDGSIITAEDVKLSYELYKKFSQQSQALYKVRLISSIEAYGDVIRILLENSMPDFPETIGHFPILPAIISSKLLNYNLISDLPYINPIGFGNFQLAEYVQNKSVRLDSYTNHTFGSSLLSGIDFIFYDTQDLLLDAFLREEVDLIQINDKSEIQKIVQFSKKTVLLENGTKNLYYINLNTRKIPFNDFSIRRAINYAINKDQITDNLFKKNGNTILNQYNINYSKESKFFVPFEYKPLDALQILFNNRFKKNSQGKLVKNKKELQFEMYIRKGSLFEESIARYIAINLGDVGINVTPISIESDELNKKIYSGEYQAVLKKFNFDPSFDNLTLRNFYFNELNNLEGFQNFNNLSFDLLIDHINNTKDNNGIQNLPIRFQNLFKRYSPCIFLFFKDTEIYVINPRFENILNTKSNNNEKTVNQFKPKHEWFVKKYNHKY